MDLSHPISSPEPAPAAGRGSGGTGGGPSRSGRANGGLGGGRARGGQAAGGSAPPARPLWLRRLELAAILGGLRLLGVVFGRLSWRASQRCGRLLGSAGWLLARRDRRRTLEHLRCAFPDLPEPARRQLGRASFRHHGTTLAEGLHLLRRDCSALPALIEVEGWEHVERARAARQPLVLITGHCGNWELLGAAFNCRGLEVAVVARTLEPPELECLIASFRRRFGIPTIARGSEGAARRILTTLRRGHALGLLIDQDTRVDGVWVDFFGRPAFTPVGAAKIALRQKAQVIPTFIERLADGRHRVRIRPPLALPPEPRAATALMTAAIEEQVRRRPEQWVWMHRRWRRQPHASAPAGAPGSAAPAGAPANAPAGAPASAAADTPVSAPVGVAAPASALADASVSALAEASEAAPRSAG
jgi:KDO2-lipid IV(A) lauroyltransferase